MERLIVDTGVLIAAERRRIRLPDLDGEAAIAAITASELLLGDGGLEVPHVVHGARLNGGIYDRRQGALVFAVLLPDI